MNPVDIVLIFKGIAGRLNSFSTFAPKKLENEFTFGTH